MLWVTREYLHLDRVATPWLISRFVDKDARFCYVPWKQEHLAPKDAIPLALPGCELGPHDEEGSTFGKVLKKYEIKSESLEKIKKIIDSGIAFVLSGYKPDASDHDGQVAVGLLAIAEGVSLTNQTDDEILSASFPIYDALYANFETQNIMKEQGIVLDFPPKDGRGPSLIFEVTRDIYNKNVVNAHG